VILSGDAASDLFSTCSQSQFSQQKHSGTPIRDSGLEKIQSDECREQIPVGMNPVSQRQRKQDEASGNQSKSAFYCHSHTSLE
jgi:hypothetical protein